MEFFDEFCSLLAADHSGGLILTATWSSRQRRGVNILERGSQVHFMAEVQELMDFPPAPKLDIFGKLDPTKATDAEKRGQDVFFGKGRCAECHQPPYYTDNLMHNVR